MAQGLLQGQERVWHVLVALGPCAGGRAALDGTRMAREHGPVEATGVGLGRLLAWLPQQIQDCTG